MAKIIQLHEGEKHNDEWPKNICAFCEQEFDHELPFTDGDGYFCEGCARELNKRMNNIPYWKNE